MSAGHAFDLAVTALELPLLALAWGAAAAHHLVPAGRAQGAACKILAATAAALLVLSPAALLARTAMISGFPPSQALSAVGPLLTQTHYGWLWSLRVAALAAGLLLLRLGRPRAAGVCLLPVLYARAATGHAADAGELSVPVLTDLLHLVATGSWAGAVLAVSLLGRAGVLPEDGSAAPWAERLSRLAGWALAATVATGLYGAVVRLPDARAVMDTAYGQVLSLKLSWAGTMALLGAFSRWRLLPRLRGQDPVGAARSLAFLLHLEAWLALGALQAAALLTHTAPPS